MKGTVKFFKLVMLICTPVLVDMQNWRHLCLDHFSEFQNLCICIFKCFVNPALWMSDKFSGSTGGFSGHLLKLSAWDAVFPSHSVQCKFILYTDFMQLRLVSYLGCNSQFCYWMIYSGAHSFQRMLYMQLLWSCWITLGILRTEETVLKRL